MDLDEIWYGCYATGDYPKIVLLNFLQPVIPTWREQTYEVGSALAPLATYSDVWFLIFGKYKTLEKNYLCNVK
jgi:hypothetical protein